MYKKLFDIHFVSDSGMVFKFYIHGYFKTPDSELSIIF